MSIRPVLAGGLLVVLCLTNVRAQKSDQAEREARYRQYLDVSSLVRHWRVQPNWLADGNGFWFESSKNGAAIIYLVDPAAAKIQPLAAPPEGKKARGVSPLEGGPGEHFHQVLSPDGGRWVLVRQRDLWLRSVRDGRLTRLTTDGTEELSWDPDWGYTGYPDEDQVRLWSPSGNRLVAAMTRSISRSRIPIVRHLDDPPRVVWEDFARAGDSLPRVQVYVVNAETGGKVRVRYEEGPDRVPVFLGWRPDGSEFFMLTTVRGNTEVTLRAVDPATGSSRTILREASDAFLQGYPAPWDRLFGVLKEPDRFLWASTRDGWNRIYLYDSGAPPVAITPARVVVQRIERVDQAGGWVYFSAHGEQNRPYDLHLYRVRLNGTRFERLTDGYGVHFVQFSPSGTYFIDHHSSLDRPWSAELRLSDGRLVKVLTVADVSALNSLGWKPPEEFWVKGADGVTDLRGVLFKPSDFDPTKRYPVVDHIYGGPGSIFAPRHFGNLGAGFLPGPALAELGYLVVRIDARGTPGRSHDFWTVVHQGIGRHEIPDHAAAIRALAAQRPYIDLDRVGAYGHSWGGHFAMRAVLQAPDLFRVAVASAPDIDLRDHIRMDVEEWMGPPNGAPQAYDYGSNYWMADRLEGKLLIIHGTADPYVPFSVTMRMAREFIRVGKPFDLLVLPDETHSLSDDTRRYVQDAIRRYFDEHLKPVRQ
ncbi:MAG: DPP IV N-terminal domain-containing protein [Gemmatimonadaceae bacterium]